MSRWTRQDTTEFAQYLRQCTDAQVQGVYEKEKSRPSGATGRRKCIELTRLEAARRRIELTES